MTRPNTQWSSALVNYEIDKYTVHVWRAYFQQYLVSDGEFLECVAKEELERAQRFICQSDRDRYIFSHGLLRSVLSAYLDRAPQQIIIKSKPYHKPFLGSPDSCGDVRFNLSHSEDIVLVAVTSGAEVGIDVEYMRRMPDAVQIVNSTFSNDEKSFLNSLPPEDFEKGFFTCWTAKEAFLKGIGKGLSYPLDKFSINIPLETAEVLVKVQDDFGDAHSWKVMNLFPGPGYSGALAIEEPSCRPQFFEYRWHL
jgi:4'-phosphopantetheinyl transferase